jgi:23S rRNA pseudouridine1911/1915/1917 synthase
LSPKFQTHQIAFPPESAGRRLDQALAQLLPQYSRTRIQRWIEEGAVRVNGLAAKARDVVVGGQSATVEARLPEETGVAAQEMPLDIVHQDAAVLVLNKAPGVSCIPARAIANTRCRTRCWRTIRNSNESRAPAWSTASTRTPAGC